MTTLARKAIRLACSFVDGRCFYCRCEAKADDVRTVVEHVVPLARGGPDDETNRVHACQGCNAEKLGRTPTEWLESQRRSRLVSKRFERRVFALERKIVQSHFILKLRKPITRKVIARSAETARTVATLECGHQMVYRCATPAWSRYWNQLKQPPCPICSHALTGVEAFDMTDYPFRGLRDAYETHKARLEFDSERVPASQADQHLALGGGAEGTR